MCFLSSTVDHDGAFSYEHAVHSRFSSYAGTRAWPTFLIKRIISGNKPAAFYAAVPSSAGLWGEIGLKESRN
jgi:hypothetical protein